MGGKRRRRIAKLSTTGYKPVNYEDGFAFSDSEGYKRGKFKIAHTDG